MSDIEVIQVGDTGQVIAVTLAGAEPITGVQIPPASSGAHRLDELDDVDGADDALVGQVLVKDNDSIWRPDTVQSGGGGPVGLTFTQPTPAASWHIVHNLNRNPQVTAVDEEGRRIFPDLEYGSLSDLTLIHAVPLAGAAYLI